MPNKIKQESTMFSDLSAFFSTPERPLTIEEVNALAISDLKEMLTAIRGSLLGS